MLMRTDAFPTRLDYPRPMMPRTQPVVHGSVGIGRQQPLNEEALRRYRRDGFLWFERVFSPGELDPVLEDLDALSRDRNLMDSDQVIGDVRGGGLRSVFAMHALSPRFRELTRDSRILDRVRQLLGGPVYIHQSRINFKEAFTGSGFSWHSDFETWHAEDGMPNMRAVSASIMLTDNNAFNGPLMLVPGSHRYFIPCTGRTPEDNWKASLRDQRVGVPGRAALRTLVERGGISAPTGPAGSLLLFECNTLHASGGNLSPWSRVNLFFVYNSVDNRLKAPFCGSRPRPEFLATRNGVELLG